MNLEATFSDLLTKATPMLNPSKSPRPSRHRRSRVPTHHFLLFLHFREVEMSPSQQRMAKERRLSQQKAPKPRPEPPRTLQHSKLHQDSQDQVLRGQEWVHRDR